VQPAQHTKTKRYIFSNCRMEFGLNEEESKNINARILTKIIEVYTCVWCSLSVWTDKPHK